MTKYYNNSGWYDSEDEAIADEVMRAEAVESERSQAEADEASANPHQSDVCTSYVIDKAAPGGDFTSLAFTIGETAYSFNGKEAEAILAWKDLMLDQALAQQRAEIVAALPVFECDYHGSDISESCLGCNNADIENAVIDQVKQIINGNKE